ncbi:NAD(P)-binding protein [Thozetella sp. PMI_491]|nr:NAD(P)-binding protein [Thozetella sp. PMI_491]
MQSKTALVTGANGYIGNAVARAFVRAGWLTYGLVRSASPSISLAAEEIIPIIGSIDEADSHSKILEVLPPTIDVIVSTTENITNYLPHYNNTIRLLRTLGTASTRHGTRPLVIFTSGCKDYGPGPHYDGGPDLQPHTEESPVNPTPFVTDRAANAVKILDHTDVFAPVLVRPTNVYGRASSFYCSFFDIGASTATKKGTPLVIPTPRSSICHALHVDDCGDAYVAIAGHPKREEVKSEVFNISAGRYETIEGIASALAVEYGIEGGVKYVDPQDLKPGQNPWPAMLIDFPQWTSSEKLRKLTGWSEHRPLFSEALHVYRLAYEAADAAGHQGVQKIKELTEYLRSTAEKQQI